VILEDPLKPHITPFIDALDEPESNGFRGIANHFQELPDSAGKLGVSLQACHA
jgi:hypothetical protein